MKRPSVPLRVFFTLTHDCNLNCKICYNDTKSSLSNPAEEVIKMVLDRIKESGVREVILTGGEPFLYQRILAVIDHILAAGLNLRINTNGLLLTDELIAELEKREGVILTLGIDGTREESHDFIRGEGNFRKVLSVLEKLSQKEIGLYVNFTVTKKNFRELFRLRSFLKRFNVSQAIINLFLGCGSGRDHRDTLSLSNTQRLLLHFPWVFSLFGPGPKMRVITSCYAGQTEANIDYNGEFFFCELLKRPLGNVLKKSVKEIWDSPQLLKLMDTDAFGTPCKECFFRKSCRGACRAEVFSETRDLYAGNQYCLKGKLLNKLPRIYFNLQQRRG